MLNRYEKMVVEQRDIAIDAICGAINALNLADMKTVTDIRVVNDLQSALIEMQERRNKENDSCLDN